jgi:hypothetical protein
MFQFILVISNLYSINGCYSHAPFPHPGRIHGHHEDSGYVMRRSSIQVARLEVVNGVLICDRDQEFELHLGTED